MTLLRVFRSRVWRQSGFLSALSLSLLFACGRTEPPENRFDNADPGDTPVAPGQGGRAQTSSGGRTSVGGTLATTGGLPPTGGVFTGTGGAFGAAGSGTAGGPGQGGGSQGGGSQGGVSQGGGTGGTVTRLPLLQRVRQDEPNKIDVLLTVDNSVSMTAKQELLAQAIPRFLRRLARPLCIDGAGAPTGEFSVDGVCPQGVPEFAPIRDIHLGVISTSLGDMGSGDACDPDSAQKDDKGLLLPSVRQNLASWNEQGFLNWDPDGRANPAGATDLEQLTTNAVDHVLGASDNGCGYEASLEAWYRFLVDPEPPESVTKGTNDLTVAGPPSMTLLAQRAAFLRPDSVLAIVMLSDENDCSIIDYGQGWIVGLQAGGTFLMPRSTAACATNPNDVCCFSCSLPSADAPAGCTTSANDVECQKGSFSLAEDHPNLRCYQQKRRFGFDLLQPVQKYVQALTSLEIVVPRKGDTNGDGLIDRAERVKNPLFAAPNGIVQRDRSMVFLLGIVGVPWQDVSDEASWSSDQGLKYLRYDELVEKGRWDWLLGSPSPQDGLMYETNFDRTGLTGVPQAHPAGGDVGGSLEPSTATALTNPINGHESNISDGSNLQSACIFELPEPIDCETASGGCDCNAEDEPYNHAVCNGTEQTHGRATPGTRQLEVLKGFGEITKNAVVASICPKTTSGVSSTDPSHGYSPALDALADRMKEALRSRCLAEPLATASDGQVYCSLLEVSVSGGTACPACDTRSGRSTPSFDTGFVDERIGRGLCTCEVNQYQGSTLDDCRTELAEPTSAGFCYVDDAAGADQDARRAIVAGCPAGARQILRLGQGLASDATLFFACFDEPR